MPHDPQGRLRVLENFKEILSKELKALRALSASSKQRTYHRLAKAHEAKIEKLMAMIEQAKTSLMPPSVDGEMAELHKLQEWTFADFAKDGNRLDADGRNAAGDLLVSSGYSFSQTVEYLNDHRAPGGAPPHDRRRTIEAYEAMQAKNMSYSEVANRFCECGGPHSTRCADRMRKRIEQLKDVLAKLAA